MQIFKKALYLLLLTPFILAGCGKGEEKDEPEQEKTPVLAVSESKVSVSASAWAGTISYSVTNPKSGVSVKAATSASWIKDFTYPSKGKIDFKVEENEGDERVGVVSLSYEGAKNVSVEVLQMSAGTSIALSPDSLKFDYSGGTLSVKVESGRPWTMEGSYDWVKPSGTEGYPGTEISFSVDTNFTQTERSAEFTFKCAANTATLTVTEASANFGISVDKEKVSIPAAGGTQSVKVTAEHEWTVSGGADWLKTNVSGNTLNLTAGENALASERTVTLTLKSGKGKLLHTASISVSQEGNASIIASFTDPNLKAYILNNYDKNSDGAISQEEADAVTALKWEEVSPSTSISSFDGIENLRNLKIFSFSTPSYGEYFSEVSKIDLTKNSKLEEVTISSKTVTEVLADGLSSLRQLSLGLSSNIKSVSLKGLSSLNELLLQNTGISAIDLSECPRLEQLSVSGTGVKSLDVSVCPNIKNLDASTSSLSSLKLPSSSKIETLSVNGAMVSLDLKNLPQLRKFTYEDWSVRSIDFSPCPKLVSIDVGGSTVKEINVSKNTVLNSLTVSNYLTGVYLEKVIMYKGQYIAKLEPDFVNAEAKNKNGAVIQVVWVDPEVPEDVAAVITDSRVKSAVLGAADKNGDGKISADEAASVTSLDLSGKGITSLDGLRYFTGLTSLNVSGNSLTSIDATAWQKMRDLNVSDNRLTSLDLSRMPVLRNINASHNKISSVGDYPDSLVHFDYSYNELTVINHLYFKSKLEYVDVSNNKITSIDVRSNYNQTYLDVSNNKIADANYDYTMRIWDLPALTTFKASNFGMTHSICDLTLSSSGTLSNNDISKLTKLQNVDLSDNTDSKFTDLVISGSALTLKSLDVTGCTSLKDIWLGEGALIPDSAIKKDAGVTVHRAAYTGK